MIGLDTNVLARFIVQDDAGQARAASRLIETRCTSETPGFVSHLVLAELTWVLERGYTYSKADVAAVLSGLLDAAELTVEEPAIARAALRSFNSGTADFAAYLIGEINTACGCETTFTFDKRSAKSGRHSLLR